MNRFVSILFLVIIAVTSIPMFVIALVIKAVTAPFDRRLRALHMFTCFWGSFYTWIMPPWRITIEGREKIRRGATYMVVSNHQSQLDILVSFRLFFHFKWVSKVEMFKVPLIGWNMALNRYIKLTRGVKESVQEMMQACEERLREGSSVFMFPEGTRSFDGTVKAFKSGAFILAKKLKIPILPIVISGTMKALPKYSVNFHGIQKMCIRVLDEVPYHAFENLSVEETAELVRGIIVTNLARLNEQLEGAHQEAAAQLT